MTEIEKDQLEDQLAQMTRWEGESTQLWREALDANEAQPTSSFWSPRFLHWRVRPLAAVIAIVGGLLIVSALALPELGKARHKAVSPPSVSRLRALALAEPLAQEVDSANQSAALYGRLYGDESGTGGGATADGYAFTGGRTDGIPLNHLPGFLGSAAVEVFENNGTIRRSFPQEPGRPSESVLPVDRQVIRKATMELLTDDVRATFLKATQLLSEARSEYLEASSLTGTGDEMQASLTLRVAADRLSEVLNQLRQLGEVRSEDSRGEDVTSQVVDLDARLRNERHIETELLDLLERRNDAPLKEILQVRSRINEVRQSIERLTAQQQRLSRLVSLASILVIIRAEDAPAPEPASDLGKYFSENVGASWTSGLRFLSDTIASLLRVLVGGVIWWVLLTVAILAITRHHRQAHLPVT